MRHADPRTRHFPPEHQHVGRGFRSCPTMTWGLKSYGEQGLPRNDSSKHIPPTPRNQNWFLAKRKVTFVLGYIRWQRHFLSTVQFNIYGRFVPVYTFSSEPSHFKVTPSNPFASVSLSSLTLSSRSSHPKKSLQPFYLWPNERGEKKS